MLRRPLSITWLARNATKQYLLLVTLLFAFAFSAQAQYETVVTTTNGCSEDGSYEYTALENGKPKYVHTTESNYSIFWDGTKWVLDYSGFTVYENAADTPLPPCGEWDNPYCTFGLVSGCTTPPPTYETVVTTSNGCSGDGTYEFSTIENGKPRYNHTSPFYTIRWYDNKWIIADPNYPQFPAFENAEDTPIPPCDGWVNLYGCPWEFSLVSGCTQPATPAAALDFNGVDDHVVTTLSGPSGNSARTVEAWVKTTNTTSTNVILDWGTNGSQSFFRIAITNDGRFRIAFSATSPSFWQSNPIDLNNGEWYYVAATYDSDKNNLLSLYVNNAVGTPLNMATPLNTTSNEIHIGRTRAGTLPFKGGIDEVRIWDRALSHCEILNNYTCELFDPTNQTGLLAYYQFNQGST
ncbi:MAG: LamG domain-containing protein [Saprospiraceae bacterium]